MKKLFLVLLSLGLMSSNTLTKEKNNPTDTEKWESLFDGETLQGWHRFNRMGVAPIWTANDGVLTFNPNAQVTYPSVHA